jgi:putative ABC transport system permease protein
VVFVIGAVMLGSAYYMVTVKVGEWGVQEKILVPIALGIVSTFLIFWSLSGLLLKLVMSVKSFYFKGLNSFTLRQLSSQVNTMVFSMTIICLMLFVTICVLSACLTMKNSLEKQIDELAPVDVQLKKTISVSEENDIVEIDNGHSIDSYQVDSLSEEEQQIISMSVEDLYAEYGIDLYDYLDNPLRFYVYHDPSLTFGATLGDRLESLQEMYQFLDYTTPEDVVRISDYNQVATLYGLETYTLKEDEYMVVADFASMVTLRDEALSAGENITVFGHSLKPKYNECQSGFIDISSNHINTGIIIVPDDVVDDHYIIYENFIGNYKKMSEEELRTAQETVQLLNFDEVPDSFSWISRSTKEEIREASIGLGALVSFIGLYLGVVFLISAAAIMALKELSESTDNIERYCMLRKLGADEKMIHKALFRQIGIFFAMPLALAILHSIFGMKFSMIFLAVLGTSGMTVSIVTTAVILALIYGGYFVLTYVCSKNMIKC